MFVRMIPVLLILCFLAWVSYQMIWKTPEPVSKDVLTKQQAEALTNRRVLTAQVDKFIIEASEKDEDIPFTLLEARENLRLAKDPDHLGFATQLLQSEWDYIKRKKR